MEIQQWHHYNSHSLLFAAHQWHEFLFPVKDSKESTFLTDRLMDCEMESRPITQHSEN